MRILLFAGLLMHLSHSSSYSEHISWCRSSPDNELVCSMESEVGIQCFFYIKKSIS